MTLQSVQTDILTDFASIESIKDEWRQLAEERSNAFITPEWFFTWFDHYGDGCMPVVSVVYFKNGKLAGLMPLALSRSKWLKKLCFAGTNLGDYFHPVSRKDDEDTVAAATAIALNKQHLTWSVVAQRLQVVGHAHFYETLLRWRCNVTGCDYFS